jgi:lipopolysaccharide export system protein LptA
MPNISFKLLNKFVLHIAFAIIFFSSSLLFSQVKGPPLRYDAERMNGFITPAGNVRELVGNVRLYQGQVTIKCDKAIHFLNLNKAELHGNVVLTQEDLVLTSDKAYYDGNTGMAETFTKVTIKDKNTTITANSGKYSTITYVADFIGNVIVRDDSVTINCDLVKYNRQSRVSQATGNVRIEDDSVVTTCSLLEYKRENRDAYTQGNVIIRGKYNNVILTGDTISNFPSINYSEAKGKPILYQIDSVLTKSSDSDPLEMIYKKDTMSIASDHMESRLDDGLMKYFFMGNTEIVKGNVTAKAKQAVYIRANDLITLEGAPIVWFDSTQLYADSIIIMIPDKKLSSIKAYGKSFAGMKDSIDGDRINQLIGDNITISIIENKIREIYCRGNSKSLYFMLSPESADGADRKSADTIIIDFVDGEINNIFWLGAITAEYFPELAVVDKIKDYYLPSFRWTDVKPKRKSLKILNK